MAHRNDGAADVTIGLDVGDRYSHLCVLDGAGEVLQEGRVRTSREEVQRCFNAFPRARVALEAGTHSAWLSELLGKVGHEVVVANPRQLRLIYENPRKCDRLDAQSLARVARLDPTLLRPIEHRSPKVRNHLALIRARDALVRARTRLVNHVRGAVKTAGGRIQGCTSSSFHEKAREQIPEDIQTLTAPLLKVIGELTAQIERYDRTVEALAKREYPQTAALQQISGVGPLTALAFVLVLGKPERFKRSRDVGAYLGLTPRRDDSGEREAQMRITKAGDTLMRRLLVGSAHYILGPFGPDSDLRRHGQGIAQRGGKNAKKRAVVAVGRKLAVLLLRLWITAEVYEPLRNTHRQMKRVGSLAGSEAQAGQS